VSPKPVGQHILHHQCIDIDKAILQQVKCQNLYFLHFEPDFLPPASSARRCVDGRSTSVFIVKNFVFDYFTRLQELRSQNVAIWPDAEGLRLIVPAVLKSKSSIAFA
jgi:hypothetical protein